MRLTLRTLLAYLDDILEPAQAKEIGEKIQESTFAASLVGKIQDVVRRRRIGAPKVTGRGSKPDPNVVAEYLDNTLPAETVTELELVCLESDMHLAEVAAAHQILTLVLGDAVDIPTKMREHMYSLGAVAPAPDSSHSNGINSHTPTIVGVGAADVTRDVEPRTGEQDLLDRLPPQLARRPGWKRAIPYVVGAVVVAGWGYLMVTAPALKEHFDAQQSAELAEVGLGGSARGPSEPGAPDLGGADSAEAGLSDVGPSQPDNGASGHQDVPSPAAEPSAIAGESDSAEPLNEPDSDDPINVEMHEERELVAGAPQAPAGAKEGSPFAEAAPDRPVAANNGNDDTSFTRETGEPAPTGDAVAAAESPDVVPDPNAFEPPVRAAEPAPPRLKPLHVQYVNTQGVLLRLDPATDEWSVMPRQAMVFPGEDLASPNPFSADLMMAGQEPLCEAVLRGGTRIRVMEPTAETRVGVEIDRGRVLLSRQGIEAADETFVFRLTIRSDEWLCELTGPDATVGIEVVPVPPTSVGDMAAASEYRGGMQVVSGAVRLTNRATEEAIELRPEQGRLPFSADPQAIPANPSEASPPPEWMLTDTRFTSLSRHFAKKYEKEFLPDQPVSASIRPVVKDSQPRISQLATETLALTGNLPGLVDALSAPHEESRIAAIEGLRNWLPRDAGNGERLDVELQNRYREEVASAISRLLWGYSEKDARNEFASRELVDGMSHDEIAVRELASYYVHRLTNRSFGYRADRRRDERDAVVRHWRERLEKNGALVSE